MGRRVTPVVPRRLTAFLPWLLPVVTVAAWQIAASADLISSRVLPAPSDVLVAAYRLGRTGELFRHIEISFTRAALGFLIGGGIGFLLGLLNGIVPIAYRLLDTLLQMARNVPHLALIPLVILWFGIDEEAKLFLVALGVFFPIYLNTYHGVRTIDAGLVEMGRAYGLHGFDLFRQIILPGALPSVLVGVRYGLGIMWLTLIVAETISSSSGIGYMTMNAREFLQTDIVVLGIVIYALLGKLADTATRMLERRWLAWHAAFQSAETVR
jgi:sulfonate transport system permease protein